MRKGGGLLRGVDGGTRLEEDQERSHPAALEEQHHPIQVRGAWALLRPEMEE